MDYIQQLDVQILEYIQTHLHNGIGDKIWLLFTLMGNAGFIWLTIAALLILNKTYRMTGITMVLALVIAVVLGEGLFKHLFTRFRPFVENMNFITPLIDTKGFSFPSGHTASSFAAAGVLMHRFKKQKWLALVLASAIAFSRMYFFLHYPSDVLGGLVLGLICAYVALKLPLIKWMDQLNNIIRPL